MIGRAPECGLSLEDPVLGPVHARLTLVDSCCVLEDLGAPPGTFLNGQPLRPGWPVPVRNGDALGLGDTELVLELAAPMVAPALRAALGGAVGRVARLRVLAGPGRGELLALLPGQTLVIRRRDGQPVIEPEAAEGAGQALVRIRGGWEGVRVECAGAGEEVCLSGEVLDEAELAAGDLLEVQGLSLLCIGLLRQGLASPLVPSGAPVVEVPDTPPPAPEAVAPATSPPGPPSAAATPAATVVPATQPAPAVLPSPRRRVVWTVAIALLALLGALAAAFVTSLVLGA
jgi:hypothetical protein